MKRIRHLGLRARLAIALAGIAVTSVGVATLLANRGLEGRLSDFARARLTTFSEHTAELAARFYRREGGWTSRTVDDLRHPANMSGVSIAVLDNEGRYLIGSDRELPSGGDRRASARVEVAGRTVGRVIVAPLQGQLLTDEDHELRSSLDRLHLVAGVIAVGIGLMVAVIFTAPLARPIRRVTAVAGRMEQGDLTSRVEGGGGAEIEQLAAAFNRLAETLKREEDLRRQTVADIAHELRTPLTGIVSRIEAAQDRVLDDESKNLEAMHTEVLRLARLVEDVERLAEAERPGLLVDKVSLDLAAIAKHRVEAYVDYFDGKGIELRQELEPAPVRGDASRLDQIVDNLLSNALRFTEEGGTTAVRVGRENGEAVLEVRDTGVGIPSDDLSNVFKRFWRGESSRSRATGGAGVGLAIVSELVRAHGGRIDVESTPGKGSRFRVILPA